MASELRHVQAILMQYKTPGVCLRRTQCPSPPHPVSVSTTPGVRLHHTRCPSAAPCVCLRRTRCLSPPHPVSVSAAPGVCLRCTRCLSPLHPVSVPATPGVRLRRRCLSPPAPVCISRGPVCISSECQKYPAAVRRCSNRLGLAPGPRACSRRQRRPTRGDGDETAVLQTHRF